jgi:hypothetical protein
MIVDEPRNPRFWKLESTVTLNEERPDSSPPGVVHVAGSGTTVLSPWLRFVLLAATLLFAALTLLYEGKAFRLLAISSEIPTDLHQRWLDQHYILRSQNPYDVFFHNHPPVSGTAPLPKRPRNAERDPAVDAPRTGGYPQWSFFTGYALYSFPWRVERFYWAAVCLV